MKRFVFDGKAEDVIEKKIGCKRKLPANDSRRLQLKWKVHFTYFPF